MVVVMAPEANEADIKAVVSLVETAGGLKIQAIHVEDHGHGEGDAGLLHELVVARLTDGGYEVVARTHNLAPGESETLTVDLAPGEYELQCNVVEEVDGEPVSHYVEGMRTRVRVI